MSAVHDDANDSSAQATATNTISFSHSTSGTNRAVFVGVGSSADPVGTTSTVTYGGTSMTEQWDFIAQTFYHNSGHTLAGDANVPTSSQTVAVTLSDTDDELCAGAISASGVDTSGTPFGTAATANGNSTTPSVNVSAATGDLVVDNCYCGTATLAPDGSQTSAWEEENIATATSGGGSVEAGAATVTMSWSISSAAWVIGGIAFKAAPEPWVPQQDAPEKIRVIQGARW